MLMISLASFLLGLFSQAPVGFHRSTSIQPHLPRPAGTTSLLGLTTVAFYGMTLNCRSVRTRHCGTTAKPFGLLSFIPVAAIRSSQMRVMTVPCRSSMEVLLGICSAMQVLSLSKFLKGIRSQGNSGYWMSIGIQKRHGVSVPERTEPVGCGCKYTGFQRRFYMCLLSFC